MWRKFVRPWLKRNAWSERERLLHLGAPVEIRTDTWGIPHLLAATDDDLFRVQGFVTARDRLFQMDLLRRFAGGRMAELFGDVPVVGIEPSFPLRGQGLTSLDYLMRVIGLPKAAQGGLSWISPRTWRSLVNYAEGVNEYIEYSRRKGLLPLGYRLLSREDIKPWEPLDSLLILRFLGFQLSFSIRLHLAFGALGFRWLDQPERLGAFLPEHLSLSLGPSSLQGEMQRLLKKTPPASETARPRKSDAQRKKKAPEERADTVSSAAWEQAAPWGEANEGETPGSSEGFPAWPWGGEGTGQGSCAWVISPRLCRGGGPLLANDPHLLLRLPASFYQIRLYGGSYDVIGLSIPGHPGVFLGHNADIAWGASLARVDDSDIFLEELDPTGERYRHQERYLPLIRQEELLHVRGEETRVRWIRSTSRGPLLSDALCGPLPESLVYSLAWTGQESVRESEAILQMNRAEGWDSFVGALEMARVPSFGFVYADKKGQIGGLIAGRCPIRSHSPRIFRPLPAADGLYDWQGEIPYNHLPRCFEPSQGYLIFAGQKPEAPLQGTLPQGFWEIPVKGQRLESLLQRQIQKDPTIVGMSRLQRDTYSLWARDFLQRILPEASTFSNLPPEVLEQVELLRQWNGQCGPESLAASFFSAFQLKLMERLLRPLLGDDLYRRWEDLASELEPSVEAFFRKPEIWLGSDRRLLFEEAFLEAFQFLQKRLGSDPQAWQWSRLHSLTLRPLFFRGGGIEGRFVRGPYATGGTAQSINTGSHSWSRPFEHRIGAAARQIMTPKAWDSSTWALCGGQSEDPQSPHYDDQIPLWLRTEALPMAFSPAALLGFSSQWLLPEGVLSPPFTAQVGQIRFPSRSSSPQEISFSFFSKPSHPSTEAPSHPEPSSPKPQRRR